MIRIEGKKITYSDVADFPPEIDAQLELIPSWTQIEYWDDAMLDGTYTIEALRAVISVMEWHAKNHQEPIEMMDQEGKCAGCGKPITHDGFLSAEGKRYCFACAYTTVSAAS